MKWCTTGIISAVCLSFALLAGPAEAGNKRVAERVNKIFERLDTNKDDKLSRAECQGERLEKGFDRIDANKDGSVSRAELTKAIERRAKRRRRPRT